MWKWKQLHFSEKHQNILYVAMQYKTPERPSVEQQPFPKSEHVYARMLLCGLSWFSFGIVSAVLNTFVTCDHIVYL
jgi:hypothetical protein